MLKHFFGIFIFVGLMAQAQATDNFLRVEISGKMLVDLPKNWSVTTKNFRQTLDTAVQSQLEMNGIHYFPSSTQYIATYFDEKNEVAAQFSYRNNSEFLISQIQATKAGAQFIEALDGGLRQGTEASAKINGVKIIEWLGTSKKILNGKTFFITSYIRTGIKPDHLFETRIIRYFDSNLNFTVTVSFDLNNSLATLLKPITNRIVQSIRVK